MQLCGYRLAQSTAPSSLFLPGTDRGLWNASGLTAGGDWLVCSDLFDALTLWCHGHRQTTVITGSELNADMRGLLADKKPAHVTFIHGPDASEAARVETVGKDLVACGVAVSRASLPSGQTLHDFVRLAPDAVAALNALLAQAVPPKNRKSGTVPPAPSRIILSPLELSVVKHSPEETLLAIEDRTYRVRGLAKNSGYEALKVSLRVACGNAWHLDTFDLAQAKQRAAFVAAAADETGLRPDALKRDVGRVLLKLEELHEAQLLAQVSLKDAVPAMTEEERDAALRLLKFPDLWEVIAEHATICGIAGEKTNVLAGYLGAVSRLLDRPLAIVVQSSSAAGKTTLMDAILAFVPPEARNKYSALTGQSLYLSGPGQSQKQDPRHRRTRGGRQGQLRVEATSI